MKQFVLELRDSNSRTILHKWKLNADQDYTIGRTEFVDIQIIHKSVSRKHAELTVFDSSISIKDLASANGTFVDKKQVLPNHIILLKAGNMIHLGDAPNFLLVTENEKKEEDKVDRHLQVQESNNFKPRQIPEGDGKKSAIYEKSRQSQPEKKEDNLKTDRYLQSQEFNSFRPRQSQDTDGKRSAIYERSKPVLNERREDDSKDRRLQVQEFSSFRTRQLTDGDGKKSAIYERSKPIQNERREDDSKLDRRLQVQEFNNFRQRQNQDGDGKRTAFYERSKPIQNERREDDSKDNRNLQIQEFNSFRSRQQPSDGDGKRTAYYERNKPIQNERREDDLKSDKHLLVQEFNGFKQRQIQEGDGKRSAFYERSRPSQFSEVKFRELPFERENNIMMREIEKANLNERERSRSNEKEQKSYIGEKEMEAKQKRKLLWCGKKEDDLETKAQIYGKVEASSEEANKFFKLMGFKQPVEGKSESVGPDGLSIPKAGEYKYQKQTMIHDLENQYNEGVKRKSGGRNGLGFN